MPLLLEDPDEGGPIIVYAGDPKVIELQIVGQDRTANLWTASVRKRPQDPAKLADFMVEVSLINQVDTLIRLTLTGDSSEGALDGQTRLITSTASFDVQEWDRDTGNSIQTLAYGQLKHKEDVTK